MFSTKLEITTLFLSQPFKDSALWYNMCLSRSMYGNTMSVNCTVRCYCSCQQQADSTTEKNSLRKNVSPSNTLLLSPTGSVGFPDGTNGKEFSCQCGVHKRPRFNPRVGKIPWRRAWQPTPGFSSGKFH